MKTYLLIILFILSTMHAMADCSSASFEIRCMTKEVYPESAFVIEGYGNDQKVIEALGEKYTLYISSSSHKVKMKVIKINVGDHHIKQAVAVPLEPLKVTGKYQITVEGGDLMNRSVVDGFPLGRSYFSEYFYVQERKFDKVNKLVYAPTYKEAEVYYFGCGPSVFAYFDLKNKLDEYNYIEVELTNQFNNYKNTYYLPIEEGDIVGVGHGMCSGAFSFSSIHDYSVRFRLPNEGMQNTSQWTSKIVFKSPAK